MASWLPSAWICFEKKSIFRLQFRRFCWKNTRKSCPGCWCVRFKWKIWWSVSESGWKSAEKLACDIFSVRARVVFRKKTKSAQEWIAPEIFNALLGCVKWRQIGRKQWTMSNSVFTDFTAQNKNDSSLVIVMNKDGSVVSVDPTALRSYLSKLSPHRVPPLSFVSAPNECLWLCSSCRKWIRQHFRERRSSHFTDAEPQGGDREGAAGETPGQWWHGHWVHEAGCRWRSTPCQSHSRRLLSSGWSQEARSWNPP